jgi:CRP/FNR family transcriptional regulator
MQDPLDRTATRRSHFPQAGSQCQGALWSTLDELCALLRIGSASLASDRMLFQHVQFKTGQRIIGFGEPFDTLYMVNSGLLKTQLIDDFGNKKSAEFPVEGGQAGNGWHPHRAPHIGDTRLVGMRPDRVAVCETEQSQPHDCGHRTPDVSRNEPRTVQRQALLGMLGTQSAEARIARFLVALSDRFAEMGIRARSSICA